MRRFAYEEVLLVMRTVFAAETDTPVDEIPAAAHFYLDLNLDSFAMVDCLMGIEDALVVSIPEPDWSAMHGLLLCGESGWDEYRTSLNAFMEERLYLVNLAQFVAERHEQMVERAKRLHLEPFTVGFGAMLLVEELNRLEFVSEGPVIVGRAARRLRRAKTLLAIACGGALVCAIASVSWWGGIVSRVGVLACLACGAALGTYAYNLRGRINEMTERLHRLAVDPKPPNWD
jgi:acyl carrier protein